MKVTKHNVIRFWCFCAVTIALSTTFFAIPSQALILEGMLVSHVFGQINNSIRELDKLADTVGGEARETIRTMKIEMDRLVRSVDDEFDENLNVAFNEIDAIFAQQLRAIDDILTDTIKQVADQSDIVITRAIKNASAEVTKNIEALEASLGRLSAQIRDNVVIVFDELTSNIILVVAIVTIIGALLFLLYAIVIRGRNLRTAELVISLMIGAVCVFLAFPDNRINLIGKPIQVQGDPYPTLIRIDPLKIDVGTTNELVMQGVYLQLFDTPTIMIGDQQVPIKSNGISDYWIIVDVSNLNLETGTEPIRLIYSDDVTVENIIEVEKPIPPPNLVIRNVRLVTSPLMATRSGILSFTVTNQGAGPASASLVSVRPDSSTFTPGTEEVLNLPALPADQSVTRQVAVRYANAGTYTARLEVDPQNLVEEELPLGESDNIAELRVVVRQLPPRSATVTVTFDSVYVGHNGDGQEWAEGCFHFRVGTQEVKRLCDIAGREGNDGTIFHGHQWVDFPTCFWEQALKATNPNIDWCARFRSNDPWGTISKPVIVLRNVSENDAIGISVQYWEEDGDDPFDLLYTYSHVYQGSAEWLPRQYEVPLNTTSFKVRYRIDVRWSDAD